MGECGTGKTRLATCAWPRAGRDEERFTTAANLVNELVEARQHNAVKRELARCARRRTSLAPLAARSVNGACLQMLGENAAVVSFRACPRRATTRHVSRSRRVFGRGRVRSVTGQRSNRTPVGG